jgi:hypothetical protein
MARSEEVLSIFLASPGDVSDERVSLVEVVADWNRAWSRNLGVRLELLRWEDDAYPDIGDDAQSVINRQIPADWDLFVGIMWSRFGTPTGRAGSGTQEEFNLAIARHQTTPDTVSILLYFKDAPVAPSKIDTFQLQQVQAFKTSMRERGLLTWDFADTDQFEKLINLHITKHVQEWRKGQGIAVGFGAPTQITPSTITNGPLVTAASTCTQSIEQTEDFGYLDLLEVFTERTAEIAEIADRLTAAEKTLSEHTIKGTKELDELRSNTSPSAKSARNTISRVANEMIRFTERVEAEVPLFRSAVDASLNALSQLATVCAELYPEQIETIKAAAIQLLSTLISARQSTEGFINATSALPRMTKELNVAKRKQVAALTALVAEFSNGERLLTEGLMIIDSLAGSSANLRSNQ